MISSGALARRLVAGARLAHRARASLGTSAAARSQGEIHPVYFKVKEIQKAYQVDNGLKVSPAGIPESLNTTPLGWKSSRILLRDPRR